MGVIIAVRTAPNGRAAVSVRPAWVSRKAISDTVTSPQTPAVGGRQSVSQFGRITEVHPNGAEPFVVATMPVWGL